MILQILHGITLTLKDFASEAETTAVPVFGNRELLPLSPLVGSHRSNKSVNYALVDEVTWSDDALDSCRYHHVRQCILNVASCYSAAQTSIKGPVADEKNFFFFVFVCNFEVIQYPIVVAAMALKPTVAIIGSGWGGYNLAHALDAQKYKVVVISPEATSAITPLLASAACGLFNSQLAQEPIRRKHLDVQYIKAYVEDIDFQNNILTCQPAFERVRDRRFELPYDKVVIAPGCSTNTFSTPGVDEYAFMVKNVSDANAIRDKINENLELASLPSTSDEDQRRLLHAVIVGGGPTGIEIAAELTDLFRGDLMQLYPHLRGKASASVHDVAQNILAPFDKQLSEYAKNSLEKHKIEIKVGSHITNVTEDYIETREDGKIAYGILIWATGNKQRPIVDQLGVMKSNQGLKRILTDDHLHVLATDGNKIPGVYALGDAADIDGASLPTTAEVAVQKASWLAHSLDAAASGQTVEAFQYHQRALVTYTGAGDGVIMGKGGHEYTGYGAWLSWRSGNLFWTRSWKRKFMMVLSWMMDWIDGREMNRF